ncbi:hypothetical protein [Gilvimarinus agarilyticus]|uniref:hypothetical protein n=1 Tax=Gilvimarinus agarilyticus TaxID=679259 RepID=UPI0005A0E11C|nr:hypothetical protein [Gilvimarinus agarilyticus]
MKKFLIGIPAALLIFVVGSKLYYSYQLDKNVDQLSSKLQMLGVEFDYKNAEVTFGGEIKVEGIFLQHPASYLSVSVDKVAIVTGSIFAVHDVLNDLQHQFLPPELGLVFEGIRLPISFISDNSANPLDLPTIATPTCGDGNAIASGEWINVGYSHIDLNSATLHYDVIGGGQQVNLQLSQEVTDMYRAEISAEVSLGAASRSMPVMAAAAPNATLLNFSIDYKDLGLNAKVLDYCETETELSADQLLAGQLQDWQDAWRLQGLEVGPKTVELYQRFLQNSDSVTLEADAKGSVNAADFDTERPVAQFDDFTLTAKVNRQAPVKLDISKLPGDQAGSWKSRYIASKTPVDERDIEINLHRDKKVYVAVDNLANHTQKDLYIETVTGKTISGQVVTLDEEKIQFQINHGGGYVIRPVDYLEISRVYFITKSKQ